MEFISLQPLELFPRLPTSDTIDNTEISNVLSEIVSTIEFDMSPISIKPNGIELPDSVDDTSSSIIEEQSTCCICMDSLNDTRNITLKCGHIFHTDCFLENIACASSNKHKCPLCREEICSEISVKRVVELEDEIVALENTLSFQDERLTYVSDSVVYLHDKLEESEGHILELKHSNKIVKKETNSLWKALKRSQDKLDKEITMNKNFDSYKKCKFCTKYGHNLQMCAERKGGEFDKKYELERSFPYVLKFAEAYIPYDNVVKSVLPGGNLYDTVAGHFVQV